MTDEGSRFQSGAAENMAHRMCFLSVSMRVRQPGTDTGRVVAYFDFLFLLLLFFPFFSFPFFSFFDGFSSSLHRPVHSPLMQKGQDMMLTIRVGENRSDFPRRSMRIGWRIVGRIGSHGQGQITVSHHRRPALTGADAGVATAQLPDAQTWNTAEGHPAVRLERGAWTAGESPAASFPAPLAPESDESVAVGLFRG